MLAFRIDPDLAAEHLRQRWPNLPWLEASARVIADSIRAAHAESPASWSLTLFDDFLRLNVGQIAVLELFLEAMVLYSVAGRPLKKRGYRRLQHQYRAVSVSTERWAVEFNAVPELASELSKRHRELIQVAARAKRVSPFKRSHSSGAIVALASLARGQIPQPEYASVPEPPPTDEVTDETPESLFGDVKGNAEVERAAVNLVRRRLQSDGWEVRSVERQRCGYDLDCCRDGRKRHVEVKGTRNEPTQFVMTAGELRRAHEDSAFVLVVVGHALSATPTVEEWRGRSFEDVFQVAPLHYVARRSGT